MCVCHATASGLKRASMSSMLPLSLIGPRTSESGAGGAELWAKMHSAQELPQPIASPAAGSRHAASIDIFHKIAVVFRQG